MAISRGLANFLVWSLVFSPAAFSGPAKEGTNRAPASAEDFVKQFIQRDGFKFEPNEKTGVYQVSIPMSEAQPARINLKIVFKDSSNQKVLTLEELEGFNQPVQVGMLLTHDGTLKPSRTEFILHPNNPQAGRDAFEHALNDLALKIDSVQSSNKKNSNRRIATLSPCGEGILTFAIAAVAAIFFIRMGAKVRASDTTAGGVIWGGMLIMLGAGLGTFGSIGLLGSCGGSK